MSWPESPGWPGPPPARTATATPAPAAPSGGWAPRAHRAQRSREEGAQASWEGSLGAPCVLAEGWGLEPSPFTTVQDGDAPSEGEGASAGRDQVPACARAPAGLGLRAPTRGGGPWSAQLRAGGGRREVGGPRGPAAPASGAGWGVGGGGHPGSARSRMFAPWAQGRGSQDGSGARMDRPAARKRAQEAAGAPRVSDLAPREPPDVRPHPRASTPLAALAARGRGAADLPGGRGPRVRPPTCPRDCMGRGRPEP